MLPLIPQVVGSVVQYIVYMNSTRERIGTSQPDRSNPAGSVVGTKSLWISTGVP